MNYINKKIPFSNPYIEIEIFIGLTNKKTVTVLFDKWYFEVQFFLNEGSECIENTIEIAQYHFDTLEEADYFFNSFSNDYQKLHFLLNKHLPIKHTS
ncbi:hypothetical protein DCE79_17510 [Lysinibacillus sp. 2017]|uniref:hypothetical protein n=1 Tax=unclassified Lysinibacillus TaxID=2636778 RepID=UPI000D526B83|nr:MULTISPECIES: hypothetical protein [unclassified Lysinibacillus]AWE09026.1 hypothetical protein DCE79_17510 [Lysinibacillus sp. 2017]TGN35465.1 hypothetical protein E4L99_09105 [Lysinibacillus sp. S2017]